MESNRTREQIGMYLEMVKVPNWQERLAKKSKDFIFEMGVFILTPAFDDEQVKDVREQLDFVLNFESFEEAEKALKAKKNIHSIKEGGGTIVDRVIDAVSSRFPGAKINFVDLTKMDSGISEEEFKKRIERAKELTSTTKISELLNIAHKLGKDLSDSTYFDKLDDIAKNTPDWLNSIYVIMGDLMKDDHYKQCGCISEKFEAMVTSNNADESMKKIVNKIL